MSSTGRRSRSDQGETGAAEGAVSVRMYDVGFGDCFLVSIPTPDGRRKVLFDCGSIKFGARPIKEVVRQVIEDAKDDRDGVPRLDVIVATHRHRDHVSGFDDPAWAEVQVKEVWMPWTEDPTDPEGRRIRDIQSRLAAQLEVQLKARLAAASSPEESTQLEHSLDLALNALTNEKAMRTLHQGFAGDPQRRFLPAKEENNHEKKLPVAWFKTPVLPGVTVHVLGPSRSEEIIRDLDPPAGQSYLKLFESLAIIDGGGPSPFGQHWRLQLEEYEETYPGLAQSLPEDDRNTLRRGFKVDEAMAAALDQAVNGTSLMLVLQVGSATLLFPGDAQWGTWRQALENQDFRRLMEETDFYKVGHHGSHNATPVEFIQSVLGRDFWAMVSTCSVAQWPKIPKKELLDAMRDKTDKVAQSDRPQEARTQAFPVANNAVIEAIIPC
jgi:beta-lactamase superfamily II metal-dependent hydrolase